MARFAGISRCSGFTLLELAIALAILSVLVVMAAPVLKLQVQRQRETELRQDLRQIRSALDAYKRASDQLRIPKATDASGYPLRLEALAEGVTDARDPNGSKIYFLRRIPRDPMNADASLDPAQTWAKRSYASPPDAPAEGADVFDVYSRSTAVGINGVPYKDW